MRTGLRKTVGMLAVALFSNAAPLQAQVEPSAEATANAARAIEKGREALARYEQGNWTEALRSFREAEALYHSPVFVLHIGRSLRKKGRLLEAKAELERVAGEALEASAPAPWHSAQSDARRELAQLAVEIPSVSLVAEASSTSAQLTLDGRAVSPGERIELDPGEHQATAIDGARRALKTFFARAGDGHQQLILTPTRLETSPVPAHDRPAPRLRPSTPPAAAQGPGPYVPGWVAMGAGVAAVGAGVVVGVLASNEFSDTRENLPEPCQGTRCLTRDQAAIERRFEPAERLALIADALWIGGAVLATAGVVLVVAHPRRDDQPRATVHIAPGKAAFSLGF